MSSAVGSKIDFDLLVSLTLRAQMSSVISASVSSISSLLVMTFIFRSESKLRGAYHRIMFFMSFWDLISSLAIALTTLPMPADVHSVYPFEGKALGNVATCEVQAFFILIGSGFTICSNCALNFYYACTIRFGMAEGTFNRVVLPVLLFLAAAINLTFPIILLSHGLLNPVISHPHCMVGSYPYWCEENGSDGESRSDLKCIRGGGNMPLENGFQKCAGFFVCLGLVIILVSLILVISAVIKTEKAVKDAIQQANAAMGVVVVANDNGNDNASDDNHDNDDNHHGSSNSSSSSYSHEEKDFMETRTALRHALMYIGAFFLTWGWAVICIMVGGAGSRIMYEPVLDMLKFIFQPLQGFFNALIFFHSKVHALRRANSNGNNVHRRDGRPLSICQAWKIVITSPKVVPDILISRMDIVVDDSDGEISSFGEPGKFIVRRGAMFRHVDECPRAAAPPPSIVFDIESTFTPDIDMSVQVSDDGMMRVDDEKGISNRRSTATTTTKEGGTTPRGTGTSGALSRKFYQWPPSSDDLESSISYSQPRQQHTHNKTSMKKDRRKSGSSGGHLFPMSGDTTSTISNTGRLMLSHWRRPPSPCSHCTSVIVVCNSSSIGDLASFSEENYTTTPSIF